MNILTGKYLVAPYCPNCKDIRLDKFGDCLKCGYEESSDAALNAPDEDCDVCGMPEDLCDCDEEELQQEWNDSLRMEI